MSTLDAATVINETIQRFYKSFVPDFLEDELKHFQSAPPRELYEAHKEELQNFCQTLYDLYHDDQNDDQNLEEAHKFLKESPQHLKLLYYHRIQTNIQSVRNIDTPVSLEPSQIRSLIEGIVFALFFSP